MSLDAILVVEGGAGRRRLRLGEYLDAAGEEAAAADEYSWIKGLRGVQVGGRTFRERFTYRGDSLWWFAELYLHRVRAIRTLCRAIRAAETLIAQERPAAIAFAEGGRAERTAVAGAAAARQVRCDPAPRYGGVRHLAAMDARSAALAAAAMLSPGRPIRRPRLARAHVAAFVHRAFWRRGAGDDGSAESYIGPVLQALEQQVGADGVRYVGVGPTANFRARRWWRRTPDAGRRIHPIESLVPRQALGGSLGVWRQRHAVRRALAASDGIRQAAVMRGCDCWPIVREALDGVALLQFPWSARAMDEAAAALDAAPAAVALTYAEAGGWGRALALEARRLGIPLAGLQHGFIYRHWLNYRHEPDEMAPAAATDAGFPLPTRTLVFDEYAAEHLASAGRFPRAAVAVTGSPRLDALIAESAALTPAAVEEARRAAGAAGGEPLVVVVSKHSEIRPHLAPLVAALRALPDVRAVVKTHPAETPALYEGAARAAPNVRVLPASAPLAPLLRGARALVTVNSTVALDGLVLGVPSLAVGLPNNLSPFVDAGAVAGAGADEEIAPALRRLLYDQGFRQQLRTAASAVAARYRFAPDGRAAERSAAAVLELAGGRRTV